MKSPPKIPQAKPNVTKAVELLDGFLCYEANPNVTDPLTVVSEAKLAVRQALVALGIPESDLP